jgi:hypothetical protein
VTDDRPPAEIDALASARRLARVERDWAEADRLKAEIEAAGWRVIDQRTTYRLRRAVPPDVAAGGVVRYGSSASVPSRLEEPAEGSATVVVVPADDGRSPARTVAGARTFAPSDVRLVVVEVPGGGDPDEEDGGRSREESAGPAPVTPPAEPETPGPEEPAGAGERPVEVVPMARSVATAIAIDAGVRRAAAPVVVVLSCDVVPTGDFVTPLVAALADPTVAIAGGWGSVTADLRRYREVTAGDADVVGARCLSFRRAEFVARGPLDERFFTAERIAAWWSLVLRDEGEGTPPRRAVVVPGLPLDPNPAPPVSAAGARPVDRWLKRDFYRILDRFGWRRDLLGGGSGP